MYSTVMRRIFKYKNQYYVQYKTEGNAKALESAERIEGTAALTDWVAKMVVVLELLTTLSIKKTDRS